MRNWLSFLLIILFPVSTWAQEMMVQGRVVDAETCRHQAEADFDAGLGIPHEEVMRKWKERLAHEKKQEMAEAV